MSFFWSSTMILEFFLSFIFFKIFHIFAASNVVYDSFFTRETPISENNSLLSPFFYSVRAFARIRQTLLLKILGGRMHGPSPPQILGGTVPLGLRPWVLKND